jgi:hypothetical protein
MPQQEEMFAPADLATLEARARANAERIRRRYQEPERRPPPRPDNVARAHLDTIHRILGEDQPADATP